MSKATANSTYLHLKMDSLCPRKRIFWKSQATGEAGEGWGGRGGASCIAKWQRTKPKLRLKTIINT